jgi:ribosome biogenesis GTPase / thiamine phosphate phosphatase
MIEKLKNISLDSYGWSEYFPSITGELDIREENIGRVTLVHGRTCRLITSRGEVEGLIPGHILNDESLLPVVGDWIIKQDIDTDTALIREVLKRRTVLSRKSPGKALHKQVMAANVDVALIVQTCDERFNINSIERYLAAVQDEIIKPVVFLNKSDLTDDPNSYVHQTESRIGDIPVIAGNTFNEEGLSSLNQLIRKGVTACLLGPSGVGKSSILNRLMGAETRKTLPVREKDSRGKHTTTYRELVKLPGGGLIIDTPGMRELALWDDGTSVSSAFPDIEKISIDCRFKDCRHESEPGCAVTDAVKNGLLNQDRLKSYHKMMLEAQYLKEKTGGLQDMKRRGKIKEISKNIKKMYKERDKPG